jgi:hypothetical protein
VTKATFLAGGPLAPSAAPRSNTREGWRDELWATIVGTVDHALRSYYNIVEFSRDPDCVLRLGRMLAKRRVMLSDGTEIRPGEPIGTIHFWNEHLPPFSRTGPDVRWAVEMHRRLLRSFAGLARFIQREADFRDVRAFRGEAAFSSRALDPQLRRVARHYGLERVPADPSLLRQLHEMGECFSAWALARVHNPAVLSRQRFFRHYHELWISRGVLIARYDQRNSAGRGGGHPQLSANGPSRWQRF